MPDSTPPVIAVLVPVLGRPHRVAPFLSSLNGSTLIPTQPIFLVSPSDEAERAALEHHDELVVVVGWEPGPGDYARKINLGALTAARLGFRFALLAADDLVFHPGWAERAVACHLETHACVVGTNDLGNNRVTSGQHATHPLVHLDYLECGTVDDPDSGMLLHPGYHHNFVDTEFVETAKLRETWAHAGDSLVEHLHHLWGKAPDDRTYRIGAETFPADQVLFARRRRLWEEAHADR